MRDTGGCDVITQVDRKVSHLLRAALLRPDEGWLCEEDVDNPNRLSKRIVWLVDPLDGAREFSMVFQNGASRSASLSTALQSRAACATLRQMRFFSGALNSGVTYNGRRTHPSQRTSLDGAVVLASRQEYKRGEWAQFEGKPFSIRQTGSVAYKLALVSAGLADATWTLSPKHEWDVAAGVALVNSAGGTAACIRDGRLQFNQADTLLPGLVASSNGIWESVVHVVDDALVG